MHESAQRYLDKLPLVVNDAQVKRCTLPVEAQLSTDAKQRRKPRCNLPTTVVKCQDARVFTANWPENHAAYVP